MLPINELLELKKQMKNRKPDFIRQDSHKKKKLGNMWRKPRGLHSKIRLHLRGRGKKVSVGYRSPKKVRYLHKMGLRQCIISSMNGFEGLDAKKDCIIISSKVGDKKKISILKKAKDNGFKILNIKNPEGYIKKVEDRINQSKKIKEDKKKEKTSVKSGEKVKNLSDKISEEGKKEVEKKEKDKVLIKKEK